VDILVAYLPAYGAAAGVPIETVGLLLTIRAASSMLSRSMMLPLRRLVGRRTLLVASMVVPALALLSLPFGGANVPYLVVAVGLTGFGLGLGQPLTMSWVATRAPSEIRATALAIRLAANRVGQFGLPAIVGVIAGTAGLSAIFWSLSGLLGVSAALVARTPFDLMAEPGEGPAPPEPQNGA
jgi:MFS family permease